MIKLKVNGADLGRALRARRKETGRTIAAVAVDAGLSVPYIANLENGRGNPTLAALDRLATALGTRLTVELAPAADVTEPADAPGDPAARLAASPRARDVAALLAADGRTSAAEVTAGLTSALRALAGLAGAAATERDLDRLLDLLLLARRPAP
ncbi:helix-turn-helix domain-containing protein [Streptomyces avicenniae]|uniref:helix-turn-helix domain-containing protein n=1 Tax=Streptomyces avicenniae TaxID=500153 RepID=UPI00167D09EF|nr:helix-turn-helix transcriptional regulator [Streptomyces avicenniae]